MKLEDKQKWIDAKVQNIKTTLDATNSTKIKKDYKILTKKTMKSKAMKLYEQAIDALRKEITEKLAKLFKDNKAITITFGEAVFTHFITDNNYVDIKGVRKKDLIFLGDHRQENDFEPEMTEWGLEEFDASALYEILLALEEKPLKFS